ncbi:MAG: hypothetical protein GQ548_02730 [Methylophaga sp.]|nr:hypothetical protein [Methylophaga sp.]
MTRIVFSMELTRSRKLLGYLIVTHILMLVTSLSLQIISVWIVLVVSLILLSFVYYCQKYQWLNSSRAIIRLDRDSDERWHLFYSNNSQRTKLILTNSVVTPYLAILTFQDVKAWKATTVTILNDAVEASMFRQLRVYCRDPKTFQK